MKSTTSDLLMRMYENAIINDPGQPVLITVCRHLRELGYHPEEPTQSRGDQRFAQTDTVTGMENTIHELLVREPSTNRPPAPDVDLRSSFTDAIWRGKDKPSSAPVADLRGVYDGEVLSRPVMVIREPDTGAFMGRMDLIQLAERLGRSPGDEEGAEFKVGSTELKTAISIIEQIATTAPDELSIPKGWVPCSPEWLNAGGNCSTAPRVYSEKEKNHYHPPVREANGIPFLLDRADGVKGHFNVARIVMKGGFRIREVWLPRSGLWGTGSGETWTEEYALRVLEALTNLTPVPPAEPKDIMSRG